MDHLALPRSGRLCPTPTAGSGEVTFSAPGELVVVGPVQACNNGSIDKAGVSLSDFRYWFNEFLIKLGVYIKVNLFEEEFIKIPIPITTIVLGKLAGNPSVGYLGKHQQCLTTTDILFECNPDGPDNIIDLSMPVVTSCLQRLPLHWKGLQVTMVGKVSHADEIQNYTYTNLTVS